MTMYEANVVSRTRRRRVLRPAIAAIVALFVVFSGPSPALAHEFGPFAIDRYAALLVGPDGGEFDYVFEFAETPTQDDGDRIEADPEAFCLELLDGVTYTVDGAPVELSALQASTLRQDGDGGLTTIRLECGWTTSWPQASGEQTVFFDDANYRGRAGWREIVVVADRTEVTGDVTDDSVTERLTDFPDADENPDASTVEFSFVASPTAEVGELDRTVPGDDDGGGDAFSGLIADADGGYLAMATALGFAAFLGALHSLAPGHGKTVIGAYLVGTRGTKIQALVLAIAVALSHTLGVLILGIITYAAGAAFAPERVYPWLQGLSALIVLGIGIWLVVTAAREYRARTSGRPAPEHHSLHPHGLFTEPHDHDHGDHSHDHGDHSHDDHDHSHDHDHVVAKAAVATLATGTAEVVEHDHATDHSHDHGDHSHDHDHDHPHDHDGHSHGDHDHGDGWHRHGIFPHTHKFDLDEMDLSGKVSWKTLAVLGLSGGLVPSTSAIIVLLGAIQLNRLTFGGLLILAFGIGMAIALVSVGLGMVALRDRAFGAMDGNSIVRTARIWVVPIAAVAVLLIGVFLLIRAVIEINGL